MDVNDLRIAVTVFSFIVFLGIVRFTWSRRRRDEYGVAEQLPFLEEKEETAPQSSTGARE
jgi:cytochrome c oxidase cbb3-type subunit IV